MREKETKVTVIKYICENCFAEFSNEFTCREHEEGCIHETTCKHTDLQYEIDDYVILENCELCGINLTILDVWDTDNIEIQQFFKEMFNVGRNKYKQLIRSVDNERKENN